MARVQPKRMNDTTDALDSFVLESTQIRKRGILTAKTIRHA